MKLTIRRDPPHEVLWNAHSHSQFSHKDALPEVKEMVKTVVGYGQKALGLTDHGNMAGSVQLYTECRKAGIKPFPGSELYVVKDRGDKKAKRHHMCVLAYTTEGYENLVRLSTLSHENFYNKPIVDHGDLADLASRGLLKGIAATSGCYFGYIAQAVARGDTDEARGLMQTYDSWFGKFYVELQNHNIDHGDGYDDNQLADSLLDLATELGVPALLTQDAHYCHESDKPVHETLKRLVAFGPEADDAVFPGDGFHLADDGWFASHHAGARYAYGAAGLGDLYSSHDLVIRQLETYSYNIPFTVADPDTALSRRCQQELTARGKDTPKHKERLHDESSVVSDTGMAGYLWLVAEVTDWCTDNQIFYQARGSASGSELCWLLGITQLDPLKWDLRFERFISRDRTKPPDIDLDIEYDRRKDLLDHLRQRFAVQQIGTWADYKLADEEDEDGFKGKGSLRVAYFARKRALGEDIQDWGDVPDEDKQALYALDASTAKKSYGTHAAGLVLTTTTEELSKLVPLMWVASGDDPHMVTQYDMNDVEALGLVKLDVLGLKTLSVLHRTLNNLGRDFNDGFDWIPLNDSRTYTAVGRGETDGVFQLEGGSSRRGVRELKPTRITDIIAAMALFRPATMDSGATASYMARRHGRELAPARHGLIEKHTSKTHGVMLFQEQVVAILRDLGMTADDLTSFLKAIKASQKADMIKAAATMGAAKEQVAEMAEKAGMTDADFDWLWHAIEGFSKYGFNQAHSTAYGLTAYWCAYLAVHHPVEFFAGLLAVAAESGSKKEPLYLAATRSKDIRLLRASVNDSEATYGVDPKGKGIRKGLVSIKRVGDKQAKYIVENRPENGFKTMEEFCKTLLRPGAPVTGLKGYLSEGDLTVGTVGNLHQAHALTCFKEIEDA